MSIDVTAERPIPPPVDRVAPYVMDWRHDHEWTQGIRRAALTREAEGGGFGAEVTRTAYSARTCATWNGCRPTGRPDAARRSGT
jgi:hypothetical protein